MPTKSQTQSQKKEAADFRAGAMLQVAQEKGRPPMEPPSEEAEDEVRESQLSSGFQKAAKSTQTSGCFGGEARGRKEAAASVSCAHLLAAI